MLLPFVIKPMFSNESDYPRRIKGSVTHASCRVALLQNTELVVPKETPWYLAELRAMEKIQATEEHPFEGSRQP